MRKKKWHRQLIKKIRGKAPKEALGKVANSSWLSQPPNYPIILSPFSHSFHTLLRTFSPIPSTSYFLPFFLLSYPPPLPIHPNPPYLSSYPIPMLSSPCLHLYHPIPYFLSLQPTPYSHMPPRPILHPISIHPSALQFLSYLTTLFTLPNLLSPNLSHSSHPDPMPHPIQSTIPAHPSAHGPPSYPRERYRWASDLRPRAWFTLDKPKSSSRFFLFLFPLLK